MTELPPRRLAKTVPRSGPARRGRRTCEAGIALVVVLASLSILSAFAMSFSSSMRLQTTLAVNETRNAQVRAALEGGIHAAVASLLHPNRQQHWPVDGTPQEYEVGGHTMNISVYDEQGKVDLNTAHAPLIRNLFAAVTQTREDAERIARRVLEQRESDVAAARVNPGAPIGPWQSVTELRYVEGVSETIFRRAVPGLTVHSGLQGIRFAVAPKLAQMAAATAGGSDGQAPSAADRNESDEGIYNIRAEIRDNGEIRMSGEAIVWIVQHEFTNYRILEWRMPAVPYVDFEDRESEQTDLGREAKESDEN